MTYSYTKTSTFTVTHARYIASKIAADLTLCGQYYGTPADSHVREYSDELTTLLRDGYVSEYEFGFKKDDKRVLSWRYRVTSDGSIETDDRPGKMYSDVDVSTTTYFNFLTYSDKWYELSQRERDRIEEGLPFKRSAGSLPTDGAGHWSSDRTYSASGTGVSRSSFRPY